MVLFICSTVIFETTHVIITIQSSFEKIFYLSDTMRL